MESSPENAERIGQALEEFGLVNIGVERADFTVADQMSHWCQPNRVEIMTSISGVTFDEGWPSRVGGKLEGLPVHFISKDPSET